MTLPTPLPLPSPVCSPPPLLPPPASSFILAFCSQPHKDNATSKGLVYGVLSAVGPCLLPKHASDLFKLPLGPQRYRCHAQAPNISKLSKLFSASSSLFVLSDSQSYVFGHPNRQFVA